MPLQPKVRLAICSAGHSSAGGRAVARRPWRSPGPAANTSELEAGRFGQAPNCHHRASSRRRGSPDAPPAKHHAGAIMMPAFTSSCPRPPPSRLASGQAKESRLSQASCLRTRRSPAIARGLGEPLRCTFKFIAVRTSRTI